MIIGHAKVNISDIEMWVEEEKNTSEKVWSERNWNPYFYEHQYEFKGAAHMVEERAFKDWPRKDKLDEFVGFMNTLESEGQQLQLFYHDDTASIVGYNTIKYILPSNLVEVDLLKKYNSMTASQLMALTGDSMSSGLVPAEVQGCSIDSVNDQLADAKDKISAMQAANRAKVEALREECRRREAELREVLEKETAALYKMQEELENKLFVLETQIYGIRCYLGEVIDFSKIRDGKPGKDKDPFVIFQKIRFLDEEIGKYLSIYEFGSLDSEKETLVEILKHRDDLRDIFCPAEKCITVMRISRTGQVTRVSDKVANMLKTYEYNHGKQVAILIRDGERLFIGWTEEDKVTINSEDMFLKPKYVQVSEEAAEPTYSEKASVKSDMVSRYFIMSVLQGAIDRGGMLTLPTGTKVTEESELIKFSFAEGWLKDNRYGTFSEMLEKAKGIEYKQGEIILTTMHTSRDDIYERNSRGFSAQYDAFNNARGIGEKNRTAGASVPGLTIMPINKILKDVKLKLTVNVYKGREATKTVRETTWPYYTSTVRYVEKDPSNEIIGSYTAQKNLDQDDFNKAESLNIETVLNKMYIKDKVWGKVLEDGKYIECLSDRLTRYRDPQYILDGYGVPEITNMEVIEEETYTYVSTEMGTWGSVNGAKVNFQLYPSEFIRTSFLCSTWLKYVVTTGNVGRIRVGGHDMSYAEALKYLNPLIDQAKKVEEEEKKLLIDAGGSDFTNNHSDWDRIVCEWRIQNKIHKLSTRSAKKFLKENA